MKKKFETAAVTIFFFFAFLGFGTNLQAQDAGDCKDHPLFSRMANFVIQDCDSKDFDSMEFVGQNDETTVVEGKKTFVSYVIKEGAKAPSYLQVLNNFENAAKKMGGTTESKGAYDIYLKISKDQSEIWVWVRALSDGEEYELYIVEKKAMVQEVEAGDILSELNTKGFAVLYINFDTDKAVIKPESMPTVNEIAAMLKANPAIAVSIEGHTDNTGSPSHNKTLSQKRAEAVVNALVNQGIDSQRVSAVGWGQDKPIADNKTEEGRAKNRRVEIVKK